MKQAKQESRKRLFVSKPIQGRLLRRFCGYWLIYSVLFVLVLAMDAVLSRQAHSFAEIGQTLWQDHFWMFVLIVAAIPIILRDLLVTTHQIAGPLVRFQGVMQQMIRGERVDQVKLRKHDMLFEFQDLFNELIEARNGELDNLNIDPNEFEETKSCDLAQSS